LGIIKFALAEAIQCQLVKVLVSLPVTVGIDMAFSFDPSNAAQRI